MSILDTVRASGGSDVIIPTLELTCSAWPESIFICAGYDDRVFITEDSRTLTFLACPMETALPKSSADVNEVITVALDNVRGLAQLRTDLAKEASAPIFVTTRFYLDSDPSYPAEPPFTMNVLSASMQGPTVQLSCGYLDLVNTAWPRDRYTLAFSPAIAYL